MNYESVLALRDKENIFASQLGIRTLEIREGYARGGMDITEMHRNIIHSVHGGCIFTLADSVGGAAAISHGNKMTTLSGNLNYLVPAIGVKQLFAEATELKYGKRVAVYEVRVTDESGKLIAKGDFTYFNLNQPFEY